MADEDNKRIIKLKGSETAREFEISAEAAKLSDLVRDSLGDGDGDGDGDEPQVIDLLNRVSTDTLEKVIDFMVHYAQEGMAEIPTPLGGSSFNEIVKQEWYMEFMVNMERPMLFDVLTAANYMGVKPLLDLACLKVTFELIGKSADEIREILNLPELTPEEEAQARAEHRWIFETS
jgi:S-phase kinase-associated protein 1